MNAAAILALIANLYEQIIGLQGENTKLQERIAQLENTQPKEPHG